MTAIGVEASPVSLDDHGPYRLSITVDSCRSTGYKRNRPQIHFPVKMATSGVSWVVRQAFNKFAHPQRCHILIRTAQVSPFRLTLL